MSAPKWLPRDVVMVMLGSAALITSVANSFRSGAPAPLPIIPLEARVQKLELELTRPTGPRDRAPSDGDEFGVSAVENNGDRCYGKVCSVRALKVGAGGIVLDGGITMNQSQVICLGGTASTCYAPISSTGGNFDVNIGQPNTVSQTTFIKSAIGLATTNGPIVSKTYVASQGADLTTGNACTPAGSLEYDTTGGCWKSCGSGLTWSGCLAAAGSSSVTRMWTSICFAAECPENASFNAPVELGPADIARMSCSWETAGAGGTTATAFEIRNISDNTQLCTCAGAACNAAANVAFTCACTGATVTGKVYGVRITSGGDCATTPGQIVCTAYVSTSI